MMTLDGNNRLKDCIQRIEDVAEAVVPLYRDMQEMIFAPVDSDKVLDIVQLWMADGGRSAESGISATTFEKLVRAAEAKRNPTANKILYWYDVEAWLNAVQDRLVSTIWMLDEFYASLPCEEKISDELIDTAILSSGEDGRKCYLAANTIFINLASVFDILTGIVSELEKFPKRDFTTYQKIKSQKYNQNDHVLPEVKQPGMLYAEPELPIVRKIETLRNEYVHSGPWDRSPSIYLPRDAERQPMPAFMMMPDMTETGTFVTVRNRNKFYSKSKKLNEELIPIVEETMDVVEKTLGGIRKVMAAQTAEGTDDRGTKEAMEVLRVVAKESVEIIKKDREKRQDLKAKRK